MKKAKLLLIMLTSVLLLISCNKVPHYTNDDYKAFLELLVENGFQYTERDLDFEHGFLSVARRPLLFDDGQLISVYVYKSNEAMEQDSENVCKFGSSISRHVGDQILQVQISWASTPHFFKGETLFFTINGNVMQCTVYHSTML